MKEEKLPEEMKDLADYPIATGWQQKKMDTKVLVAIVQYKVYHTNPLWPRSAVQDKAIVCTVWVQEGGGGAQQRGHKIRVLAVFKLLSLREPKCQGLEKKSLCLLKVNVKYGTF